MKAWVADLGYPHPCIEYRYYPKCLVFPEVCGHVNTGRRFLINAPIWFLN